MVMMTEGTAQSGGVEKKKKKRKLCVGRVLSGDDDTVLYE